MSLCALFLRVTLRPVAAARRRPRPPRFGSSLSSSDVSDSSSLSDRWRLLRRAGRPLCPRGGARLLPASESEPPPEGLYCPND